MASVSYVVLFDSLSWTMSHFHAVGNRTNSPQSHTVTHSHSDYRCHAMSMVRQPIGPTTHWSENPLVRRPIGSKTHWSEDPLVRKSIIGPKTIGPKKCVIGPKPRNPIGIGPKKCHWSENSGNIDYHVLSKP